MYIHEGPPLYLADDQETVVEEGDPRAAFLLIREGGQMSDEDADRYGLTGKKAKSAAPNKSRTAPGENKGRAASGTDAEIEFTPAPELEAEFEEEPRPRKGK